MRKKVNFHVQDPLGNSISGAVIGVTKLLTQVIHSLLIVESRQNNAAKLSSMVFDGGAISASPPQRELIPTENNYSVDSF